MTFVRLSFLILSFIVSSPCFLFFTPAWADGIHNPFQSASATGPGAAFIAQADDPSAVHYNPAGMTQLRGVQHSAGAAFVSPKTTYRNSAGEKVSNRVSGSTVGLPPPVLRFMH